MRRSRVLVGIVAALVVLAGCGTSDGQAPPASAPPAPAAADGAPGPQGIPEGMGAAEPDGVFPRTVTHFGGRTRIDAEPTRVVVIATGQTDAILTLGVVPAGAAAGDGADLIPRYVRDAFPQYAAQLDAMPSVGQRQNPNLESLAALRPDLIMANAAASQDIYPALSQIAPTVLVQGTGVNWKQDFLLLADSLGREGVGRAYLDAFEADAKALGARAGDRTVSFVRVTVDRTRVFGVPSFPGFIAWDAGLARPATQQFDKTSQDLSPEQLRDADGDLIFYSVQGSTSAADAASSPVLGSELWRNLTGEQVWVDDDPWYLNAGPTAARLVLDGLTRQLAP
ncbi:ABC transporter substrate-binding protein [Pseudonocardia sp. WMMC193]|uniref:ABC transporter substrate-binding protein n=1 Tax=Pseudonocardia sp. WMMC193 TaxID=2911965 RepID=UPI001F413750|nr:ABC transporter substrate-binding protein [Pseudonocardia sp. WMMC193]MCF7553583.1 ABC transporter substrate-binding protein [Pseudonocardia sp. WMMC193]